MQDVGLFQSARGQLMVLRVARATASRPRGQTVVGFACLGSGKDEKRHTYVHQHQCASAVWDKFTLEHAAKALLKNYPDCSVPLRWYTVISRYTSMVSHSDHMVMCAWKSDARCCSRPTSTPKGFKPVRAEPNGVHPGHSVTVSRASLNLPARRIITPNNPVDN